MAVQIKLMTQRQDQTLFLHQPLHLLAAAKVEILRAQVAVLAVLVAAVLVEVELQQVLGQAVRVVMVALAVQAGQHKTLRAAAAGLAR